MKKRMNVQTLLLLLFITVLIVAQVFVSRSQERYRIMFYNVENLFHPSDDPLTDDDEFTPGGVRSWDQWKYREKLNRIYKVIAGVGTLDPPAIIGLCEVESAAVLRDLVQVTPLRRYGYKYIHFDSPDRRGIDVAMLFRPDLFLPVAFHPVTLSDTGKGIITRDLLYVHGVFSSGDSIHCIVAHWPSRYGGYLASGHKRLHAAKGTLEVIDSIFSGNRHANVLVMGDFNDEPLDSSMLIVTSGKEHPLVNLMQGEGSIRHEGKWYLFDQFLASRSLLNSNGSLFVRGAKGRIYKRGFLLEKDEKWLGHKPYRTFKGFRYQPGFSDHLPVYVDLVSSGSVPAP